MTNCFTTSWCGRPACVWALHAGGTPTPRPMCKPLRSQPVESVRADRFSKGGLLYDTSFALRSLVEHSFRPKAPAAQPAAPGPANAGRPLCAGGDADWCAVHLAQPATG